MSALYAPVDDMEGKSPTEVLRELAWTRRQRADLIADRDAHAKARGDAEHRRSKAERALADARRSFRGALDALGKPRTITTAEELDALPVGSVVLHNGRAFQHYPAYPAPFDEYQQWKCGDGGFVRSTKDGSSILPALVIHEAQA